MPDYQYWATTESGDTVTGRLTAATPDAAAHLLTLRGWVLQRLEESTAASVVDEPVALTDADFPTASESPRELESGLPLIANLRSLAEETSQPRTRRALFNVISAVEHGRPWEQALGELEAALPRRFAPLIKAGVETGQLPFLMHHALDHLRRVNELKRRLMVSLVYPLALILLACIVNSFLFSFVVPNFKKIFEDFGTDLPGMTKVLLGVSDAMVTLTSFLSSFGWWSLPLGLIVVAGLLLIATFAFSATSSLPEVQRIRQWFVRVLPIIGPVLHAASLSGWFRLVATLTEARFSLPDSLRIAAAANGDALLASGVERMIAGMNAGEVPLVAAERAEALPREVLPIFRWAKSRQLFCEGLQGAADIYAARSQMQSGLVTVLLEPLLVFGIGMTVGLVVIALFLPLVKLLNDLA